VCILRAGAPMMRPRRQPLCPAVLSRITPGAVIRRFWAKSWVRPPIMVQAMKAMEISQREGERLWTFARAWLRDTLGYAGLTEFFWKSWRVFPARTHEEAGRAMNEQDQTRRQQQARDLLSRAVETAAPRGRAGRAASQMECPPAQASAKAVSFGQALLSSRKGAPGPSRQVHQTPCREALQRFLNLSSVRSGSANAWRGAGLGGAGRQSEGVRPAGLLERLGPPRSGARVAGARVNPPAGEAVGVRTERSQNVKPERKEEL